MKKYSFLVITLFFSISALAGYNQKANMASGNKVKKDIYLQLYSLRDDIKADFAGTIAKVAEIGYIGVEAANYVDAKFYGLSPEEFKKSIKDAGLEILSSHVARPLAGNTADTNWDEIWQWWDTAIQAHKNVGVKYLILAAIRTPRTLADLQTYAEYFNKIGEKCNAAGIRFGYHNHKFEFQEVEGKIIYDYLLENTDPTKVFFQQDVYWVVRGGKTPVEYFKKYPGRFEILHIKDEKELGQSGSVGFDAIFNHIKEAGTKYIIVEVEKYDHTPIESVKLSYDYLIDNSFVQKSYSK
jgi:Sugar phosphate isomerases/epimerases